MELDKPNVSLRLWWDIYRDGGEYKFIYYCELRVVRGLLFYVLHCVLFHFKSGFLNILKHLKYGCVWTLYTHLYLEYLPIYIVILCILHLILFIILEWLSIMGVFLPFVLSLCSPNTGLVLSPYKKDEIITLFLHYKFLSYFIKTQNFLSYIISCMSYDLCLNNLISVSLFRILCSRLKPSNAYVSLLRFYKK